MVVGDISGHGNSCYGLGNLICWVTVSGRKWIRVENGDKVGRPSCERIDVDQNALDQRAIRIGRTRLL